MAKLRGMPTPQKAPSLRGIAYVSTWRGITYLSKWPTKKTRPLPPHTQVQNEWFRQANIAFKYQPAEFQIACREATKGTPLYPRDVALMCMAGTLAAFRIDNGKVMYSMATRKGVNDSLMVLGQEEFGVLVLIDGFYRQIIPSEIDQVITSNGPGVAPSWRTGPAGTGKVLTGIQPLNVNSSLQATKGWTATINQTCYLRAGIPFFQSFPTGSYVFTVWKIIGLSLFELLWESDTLVTPSSEFRRDPFPLPMNLELEAGTKYAFLLTRTDGSGTSTCQLWNAATWSRPQFPWSPDIVPVSLASNDPQSTDVLTPGTASSLFVIDLLYSF